MLELKTDKKWKDTIIGVASQQPVPMWAEECLEKVLDAYHICSTREPGCKCHGCKFNSGCKFKILRVQKVPNEGLLL